MNSNARVLVIYTHYPHYRRPVFSQLLDFADIDFEIVVGRAYGSDGILQAESPQVGNIATYQFAKFIVQTGVASKIAKKRYGLCIFLGNPYVLSTWVYLLLCKALNIKTLLWTHGWLDGDSSKKNKIRDCFYRLANGLLLYNNNSKKIGIARGFSQDRLTVIYNSLDFDAQKKASRQVDTSCHAKETYLLSIGRLTPELKLELIFDALWSIKSSDDINFPLKVIGAGQEEKRLRSLAIDYGIDVTFLGAQYDETIIAREIMGARALVCPGKVGLTAMHSMVYGTPVLTHNNLKKQMPEVEALINSETGIFYDYGSLDSLILKLKSLFGTDVSVSTSEACIREIQLNWNPERQVKEIVSAVNNQLNG